MAYRILSLNGGGVRGICQAVYLFHAAKYLPAPLFRNFELIAGTSTGALIALGIALEVDPKMLVELFEKNDERIFGRQKFASVVRKGAKYSAAPLRTVLDDVYKGKRLGDCKVPVVICSTVLDQYRHRVFTTLERCGGKTEDSGLLVADVAMASCAAPTYFPSFRPTIPKSPKYRSYVDGGLWANNPSLVAVIEAHANLRIPFEDIRLVSLGNGNFPSGSQAEKYDSARTVTMIEDILELMFASQNAAADDFAAQLIGPENVLRINVELAEPIKLDDVKTAIRVLPARAESVAVNERRLSEFLSAEASLM